MTTPEMRASHDIDNAPETLAYKDKTTDELIESLLEITNPPVIVRDHGAANHYVPEGKAITAENIINLREKANELRSLEHNLAQRWSIFARMALKKSIKALTRETVLPDGAQSVYDACRVFSIQHPGPQISNEGRAFWSLSVTQNFLVYKTERDDITEIPDTKTHKVNVFEYYRDENGEIATQHDFSESELHDRLVFTMAHL